MAKNAPGKHFRKGPGLKGVDSMKLHRDLGIGQSSAWHLAHRIRKAWAAGGNELDPFTKPVEADKTFVSGKARNMRAERRREVVSGRGRVGKRLRYAGLVAT